MKTLTAVILTLLVAWMLIADEKKDVKMPQIKVTLEALNDPWDGVISVVFSNEGDGSLTILSPEIAAYYFFSVSLRDSSGNVFETTGPAKIDFPPDVRLKTVSIAKGKPFVYKLNVMDLPFPALPTAPSNLELSLTYRNQKGGDECFKGIVRPETINVKLR